MAADLISYRQDWSPQGSISSWPLLHGHEPKTFFLEKNMIISWNKDRIVSDDPKWPYYGKWKAIWKTWLLVGKQWYSCLPENLPKTSQTNNYSSAKSNLLQCAMPNYLTNGASNHQQNPINTCRIGSFSLPSYLYHNFIYFIVTRTFGVRCTSYRLNYQM